MHRIRSIRRLALGAFAAGAVACALPTMASAASTCAHHLGSGDMTITDGSGPSRLRVFVYGNAPYQYVAYSDGGGATKLCYGETIATPTNTNTIHIVSNGQSAGGYWIDHSGGPLGPGATLESDGMSEIETTIYSGYSHPKLLVTGTSGPDVINVGGSGLINVGSDTDTEIDVTDGPSEVVLDGGVGADNLTGDGYVNGFYRAATVPLRLYGGVGNDTLVGGFAFDDRLHGGPDHDMLFSIDQESDTVTGDGGYDTAEMDLKDKPGDIIENRGNGNW